MTKKLPFYPFLIAVYPILTLYARNPGEIPFEVIYRPTIISLLITGLLVVLFSIIFKDLQKAAFISALAIFYFSSSGHVYRILKGYLFPLSDNNFHPVLLALETLLIIILALPRIWNHYFSETRVAAISKYFNIATLLVLLYPLVIIINFLISSRNDSEKAFMVRREITTSSIVAPENPPDIYYIILDGYARSDVLEELYDFNNSEFIKNLEARGFYVASDSHSNYVQTPLSFASFLNSAYFEVEPDRRKSINRLPLFDLIRSSNAITLLKDEGYEIVATDSGFEFTHLPEADLNFSPFPRRLSTFEQFFLSTTAFDIVNDLGGHYFDLLRRQIALPGYNTHREEVLFALDALKQKIPGQRSPKFVLVHIVSPHPPFVLNDQGDPIEPNRPYMPGDGEAFGGSHPEYQSFYREQVIYINTKTLEAIDAILTQSNTLPIIIIQGDHGPGSLLRRDSVDVSCLWERSSILNAYYFPDRNYLSLYPEITPVNTFRVIFNNYFDTEYSILPDRVYFSPQTFPYDFYDITEKANEGCDYSK